MTTPGKAVLITGASSGIGNIISRTLHGRGFKVIATCRDAEQAEALKGQGACDSAVLVDFEKEQTVLSIAQQLRDMGIESLAGLIHCAGITEAAPIETVASREARRLFEINVFGTLFLIQTTADFLRNGQGRMILTSSVAGFSVWPMLGIYAASKHAVEALADAARRELWPWGIKVSVVRPGGIKTRMLANHLEGLARKIGALEGEEKAHYLHLYRKYADNVSKGYASDASYVAEKVVKVFATTNPKPLYYSGTDVKVLRALDMLLPDRVMDSLVKRLFPSEHDYRHV